MAKSKKKKKSSPSAKAKANHYKAKGKKKSSKNPGVSLATVRAMLSKKKGKKKGHSKRNPQIFGAPATELVANSAAVLGAVTIGKLVPAMFPATWTSTDLRRFLTTLGVAAATVTAAHFLIPKYRNVILLGAGAQTLSTALNPVLRKVSSNITLGRLRASGGLRDFVKGNFTVPENVIYNRMVSSGMNVRPGAIGPVNVGKYAGRWN